MNIDRIIGKIYAAVNSHRLDEGVYCRWLWQDDKGSRRLGVNEYGCADAANILYTIGRFERDPEKRRKWVRTMQAMQDPETGMFTEATHHPIHTTAHVTAALELFDALPAYPVKALYQYRDRDALYAKLESLDWDYDPWPQSHQGAGLFAALAITREVDAQWQDWYFDWLREKCDPEAGMSYKGRLGHKPLNHHLNGWFHYLFNHNYAQRAFPYPEKLIDSCLGMYAGNGLGDTFGRTCNFAEIDWVFALNRATRQTPHRFAEAKAQLRDFAGKYIAYMDSLDGEKDESFNDLHMLFGAVCALAELQQALPGEIESTVPLKLVLDRRPFI